MTQSYICIQSLSYMIFHHGLDLDIFFCRMPVQVFCPFLKNWVVRLFFLVIFLIPFYVILYILASGPLLDMRFCVLSVSHSVGSFMLSLDELRLLILILSICLFFFFLMSETFLSYLLNLSLLQALEDSLLHFPLKSLTFHI